MGTSVTLNRLSFAGHLFQRLVYHPEGNFLLSIFDKKPIKGSDIQGAVLVGGYRKGCCYTPVAQQYHARIRVLKGSGKFLLLDKAFNYESGSEFTVDAYVAHSFVKVEEDSVFIKTVDKVSSQ